MLHTTPNISKHQGKQSIERDNNSPHHLMKKEESIEMLRVSECPSTLFLQGKINRTIAKFQKKLLRIPLQEIPLKSTKKSSVFRKISFGEKEKENGVIHSLPR